MNNSIARRNFLKTTGLAGISTLAGLPGLGATVFKNSSKKIKITGVNSNFEREPLIRPFGFKGGYMTEIWQTINYMENEKFLYVRVKDQTGNDFICPIDSLIDPEKATEEALENCVDDGVVGRYAGNIEIAEQG